MNDFSVSLAQADIAKFTQLYKKNFNIELDEATAREKLNLLLTQMYRVYKPIKAEQVNQLKNENENYGKQSQLTEQ